MHRRHRRLFIHLILLHHLHHLHHRQITLRRRYVVIVAILSILLDPVRHLRQRVLLLHQGQHR